MVRPGELRCGVGNRAHPVVAVDQKRPLRLAERDAGLGAWDALIRSSAHAIWRRNSLKRFAYTCHVGGPFRGPALPLMG
jgi:hypothetical protein